MYQTEYRRILDFTLFEEIRLLHPKDVSPNPFQSAQFPISLQLSPRSPLLTASSNKHTFLGTLLFGLVDDVCSEDCWYSEASCGWWVFPRLLTPGSPRVRPSSSAWTPASSS